MTTPLDQLLKKEEELRAKATPGPWSYDVAENEIHAGSTQEFGGDPYHIVPPTSDSKFGDCNAPFIVHACNTSQTKSEIIRVLVEALENVQYKGLCMTAKPYECCHYFAKSGLLKAQALAEKGLK